MLSGSSRHTYIETDKQAGSIPCRQMDRRRVRQSVTGRQTESGRHTGVDKKTPDRLVYSLQTTKVYNRE